jgi:hypothetical protein
MPGNTCRICKKPLTDFTSVRLGIGPVCRVRDGLNGELDLIPHADFSVQLATDDFIYIRDAGAIQRVLRMMLNGFCQNWRRTAAVLKNAGFSTWTRWAGLMK